MSQRKRTRARAEDRAQHKLARDLDKLAQLSPGGSPERAIPITSPSEVEVRARATPCPVCAGELRVLEHTAETVTVGDVEIRVRVARAVCAVCRRPRAIYFRLAPSLPS